MINNLFSQVLDLPNVTGYEIQDNIAYIEYNENDEVWSFGINIHELAHKCKEWAMTKGYHIESMLYDMDTNGKNIVGLACLIQNISADYTESGDFEAPTEPEAIFIACQWILEQSNG